MRSEKACNNVMDCISSNYSVLRGSLIELAANNLGGQTSEDFLHDAIILIAKDQNAAKLTEKKDIMNLVKFRFKMLIWRAHHETKEIPFSQIFSSERSENENDSIDEN